ncbi:sigma-70 family RNA polymerase sigma factor [Hymenobacter lucidus]|uniref:Sigma-70 family RNA polymerase sigma factor n=1 Tax=Hymenobacter lucidus TaxID=2880930 RepID=A0ABS8AUK5_9BACT|nr:sigma-70 family RNA polymerase sigma factor [Hymenobacter lucidus]MCB2409739.1 sigma-70 family RNA polymerase sigma factor [Hymenobacter lucidus]
MPSPVAPCSSPALKLYAAWDDAALAEALLRDDELAFAEIYERYWLPLLRLAHRKVGTREGAEEIVQELFLALWNRRREQPILNLSGYLHAAVRYQVLDWLKSRMTHAAYLSYTRRHPAATADHGTEQALAAADLSMALASSLSVLPLHTREVFRRSRFEHQSVREIAGYLNLSQKTVEYHLTRALKVLRVRLKDFLVLVFVLLWG